MAISEDRYRNKLGGCSDIVVDAYLSSGVLMDCKTRHLPIEHDVETAPPLGVLKTMVSRALGDPSRNEKVSRAPEDPSRNDMVSRAPKDPSLEVAIVVDVSALSIVDRVDVSRLSSWATLLPHPILREVAVHAGDMATMTRGGVARASLVEGGVAGVSPVQSAVDLGDEVRFVRPSQAQDSEPSCVRGSVLRLSYDGVVDLLNNANRRAIIHESRTRLLIMLQVVQFDNPLPFLIGRTSRSVKRVHFPRLSNIIRTLTVHRRHR